GEDQPGAGGRNRPARAGPRRDRRGGDGDDEDRAHRQRCGALPFQPGVDGKHDRDPPRPDLARVRQRDPLAMVVAAGAPSAVREGKKICSPGPSWTLMLKSEYPELLPGPDSKALADAVVDASDLVLQLARGKKLSRPAQKIGKVAVHVPCHNRVQNIGYRGRDLLKWAGADVQMVDRCCGMDGTWGMKKEFFAESLKVAEKAARAVEGAEPDVVCSDCPLAGLQLTQKTGRRSFHLVRILQAAYRREPLRSPTGGRAISR